MARKKGGAPKAPKASGRFADQLLDKLNRRAGSLPPAPGGQPAPRPRGNFIRRHRMS